MLENKIFIYENKIKRINKEVNNLYALYYLTTDSDKVYSIIEYWDEHYLSSNWYNIKNVEIIINDLYIPFIEYIESSNKKEIIYFNN